MSATATALLIGASGMCPPKPGARRGLYGRSGCLSSPSHQVTIPTSSPETTGIRMLRLESRPQSSTEKAGVPIADVQRSQLDTPPTSAQPHGIKKRKAPRKATTPATTESHLRDVTSMVHQYGPAALEVPICVVSVRARSCNVMVVLGRWPCYLLAMVARSLWSGHYASLTQQIHERFTHIDRIHIQGDEDVPDRR